MEHVNAWKAAVTAVFGALTALWGWMGWLVIGWIALMLLDYLTGSAAALKAGEWSSKVAREGIWHKLGLGCGIIGRVTREHPGIICVTE